MTLSSASKVALNPVPRRASWNLADRAPLALARLMTTLGARGFGTPLPWIRRAATLARV